MIVSQVEIDAHIANVLRKYNGLIIRSVNQEIQEIIIQYIRKGFLRLNLLSEDDPVWEHNKKPTLHKLGEYIHRVSADEHDEEICWIAIARSLYYCTNDFGRHHFEHLIERDFNHMHLMVGAARRVWEFSGYDTTGLLRESLEKMKFYMPKFDKKLSLLGNSQDKRFQESAIQIRKILKGFSLSRALK
jgi:hypothetical protein